MLIRRAFYMSFDGRPAIFGPFHRDQISFETAEIKPFPPLWIGAKLFWPPSELYWTSSAPSKSCQKYEHENSYRSILLSHPIHQRVHHKPALVKIMGSTTLPIIWQEYFYSANPKASNSLLLVLVLSAPKSARHSWSIPDGCIMHLY